ncbi:MAG TPA: DUF1801 domain-containing protein [Vicinamibacterales bacterium]
MAELKTRATRRSVAEFIDAISDESRRRDCKALVRMMKKATKAQPRMWGSSIIGFGDVHYKYASGREIDWFRAGFSPRKDALTLYLTSGVGWRNQAELMSKLGKHKTGKGCLYIKQLSDVDAKVLERLIGRSVKSR